MYIIHFSEQKFVDLQSMVGLTTSHSSNQSLQTSAVSMKGFAKLFCCYQGFKIHLRMIDDMFPVSSYMNNVGDTYST
jgi:hypothetical protein